MIAEILARKTPEPPMTAGDKAMRKDPAFPDATDADILSLFEGPVKAMREQAEWLMKCLDRNKGAIDIDLWRDLGDIAGDLLNASDIVLCTECRRLDDKTVRLGRGRGFDACLCDQHEAELMERGR